MGDELTRPGGRYWVLFYQPLPEAGERLSFGLVFEDAPGRARVEYDASFAKVLRIYPDTDMAGLAYRLDSLRADLSGARGVEEVVGSYGSQIVASPARRIAVPIAESTVQVLMKRHVYPAKAPARPQAAQEDGIAREIGAFLKSRVSGTLEFRTGVSAREVLGRPVAGVRSIALGIRDGDGWTLVDGVDLNQLSAQQSARRADEIARTYWNYGRAARDAGVSVRRIGIVLNGHSHLAPKTAEAHDYALHRFESEADLAVDAASAESAERLAALLAGPNASDVLR